jgi:hypothetical protein
MSEEPDTTYIDPKEEYCPYGIDAQGNICEQTES